MPSSPLSFHQSSPHQPVAAPANARPADGGTTSRGQGSVLHDHRVANTAAEPAAGVHVPPANSYAVAGERLVHTGTERAEVDR